MAPGKASEREEEEPEAEDKGLEDITSAFKTLKTQLRYKTTSLGRKSTSAGRAGASLKGPSQESPKTPGSRTASTPSSRTLGFPTTYLTPPSFEQRQKLWSRETGSGS